MKKMIYTVLLFCGMIFSACNDSMEIVVPDKTPTIEDDGSDIEFTPEQLKLPRKKGACFTLRENNKVQNMGRVATLMADWNYSWGADRVYNQLEHVEFVPMAWGKINPAEFVPKVREQINTGHTKRVLGFNEPDGVGQANMSVEKAIELWPALMSLKIPLGSPAVVDAENGEWIEEFMAEVENRGYRVDYLCVHNYGGGSAPEFKRKMTAIYEKYKRPLLITEFAVADWNAQKPEDNRHSEEKVLKFMKEVLPWLEETEFIYGYAWFSFEKSSAAGCTSALFDENNNLTKLGEFYRNFPENINPPETGENLVLNPGFEDGYDNWSFSNNNRNRALELEFKISGNQSLKFKDNTWVQASQTIKGLEAGKTYEFGMTGRIQDIVGPEGTQSSGKMLIINVKDGDQLINAAEAIKTSMNTKVSSTITIDKAYPNGLTINIWHNGGTSYIDDVFFWEVKQ